MIIFSERMRYWDDMVTKYEQMVDLRLFGRELELLNVHDIYCWGSLSDKIHIKAANLDIIETIREAKTLWVDTALETQAYPREAINSITATRVAGSITEDTRYFVSIGIPLNLRGGNLQMLVSFLIFITLYLNQNS